MARPARRIPSGAGHIVEARGVHVEAHVAARSSEHNVLGTARHLQMALGLEFRGFLVVDHLVGAEHVIAIMKIFDTVESGGVTHPGLAVGLP